MGLDVHENKSVSFNDTHQKLVDTSLDGNPTRSKIKDPDLEVRHVFRRNNTGDLDRDGNPLIHALKGMRGYEIWPYHREKFMSRAREVVRGFSSDLEADVIVPVPSSNPFCAEFASLLAEETGLILLGNDFVRKRTIEEMLELYDGRIPDGLSQSKSRKFKSQLGTWRKQPGKRDVSMKDVDTGIRLYMDPLVICSDVKMFKDKKVIIVDDLMSSGCSISALADKLSIVGAQVHSGVTFLSSL